MALIRDLQVDQWARLGSDYVVFTRLGEPYPGIQREKQFEILDPTKEVTDPKKIEEIWGERSVLLNLSAEERPAKAFEFLKKMGPADPEKTGDLLV